MDRRDVILDLIKRHRYHSYLEIGCCQDYVFNSVPVLDKVGVDPVSGGTLRETSDAYFARSTRGFDLIFVDADHHQEQVNRDLWHAWARLNTGGRIVVHDCLPPDVEHLAQTLCGDGWEVLARWWRGGADMRTLGVDMGVGIIKDAPGDFNHELPVAYSELVENPYGMVGLVSWDDYLKWDDDYPAS